ncbi:hypothetical protein LTS18_002378, partial [Coniosporium uncinatum]
MPSLRSVLLFALPFAYSVLAQEIPLPSEDPNILQDDFETMLSALPEESLHAALHVHVHPKFQDGVFEHDWNAVAAVHETDAPLATRLISAAQLELAKRQASNTTTEAPAPAPSSTSEDAAPAPSSTLEDAAPAPSSSLEDAAPAPSTTADAAPAPSSVAADTPTQAVTSEAAVETTDAAGNPTTSAVAVIATTDAAGSAVETTAPIVATTDAQGSATSVALVPTPDAPASDAPASNAPASDAPPSDAPTQA